MAEDLDSDVGLSPMEPTTVTKEVTILLAGKSGAGKTTLFKTLFDSGEQKVEISPNPITKVCESLTIIQNDVAIIGIDTPGIVTTSKKEEKTLQEAFKHSKADLLIYCVPVDPSSKFIDRNPEIIKSFQDKLGKEIWKKCIIVFTFSNFTRFVIPDDAEYVKYLKEYGNLFEQELKKIGNKAIKVKTIFDYKDLNADKIEANDIIAVPAGLKADETNIIHTTTQLKWSDIIFILMVLKGDSKCSEALVQHKMGKRELKKILTGLGLTIGGVGLAIGTVAVLLFRIIR